MKHKILLRRCEQVGMYDWDNHYRSVEIESVEIDALVKDGWVIYGAEDAPLKTVEAKTEQHTTGVAQNVEYRTSGIARTLYNIFTLFRRFICAFLSTLLALTGLQKRSLRRISSLSCRSYVSCLARIRSLGRTLVIWKRAIWW
jgi:hypothetical protein